MIALFLRMLGLVLCLIIAAFGTLRAQDPIFTQYTAYKLYLNPAFTGYEPGLNIDSGFRTQWHKVAESNGEFLSNYFGMSIELPELRSGLGFSYMDNVEGEGDFPLFNRNQRTGGLRYQRVALSYAWRSWLCEAVSNWDFSLGFSGAVNYYSQDWSTFVFSDQLDPIRGNVRPTQLSYPTGNQQNSYFYDFSAGGLIHWRTKYRMLRMGAAFHHIAPQDVNPSGWDSSLPMRYTFHVTGFFEDIFGSTRRGDLQLIPVFKIDLQRSAREPKAFTHSSLQTGAAIKNLGLHRVHIGLFFQSNHYLNLRNTNQHIKSIVAQTGYEFVRTKTNKNAVFIWEVTGSWTHDIGKVTGLGDVFELSLNFSFPTVSLFGAGCSNCKLKKLMQRF